MLSYLPLAEIIRDLSTYSKSFFAESKKTKNTQFHANSALSVEATVLFTIANKFRDFICTVRMEISRKLREDKSYKAIRGW